MPNLTSVCQTSGSVSDSLQKPQPMAGTILSPHRPYILSQVPDPIKGRFPGSTEDIRRHSKRSSPPNLHSGDLVHESHLSRNIIWDVLC